MPQDLVICALSIIPFISQFAFPLETSNPTNLKRTVTNFDDARYMRSVNHPVYISVCVSVGNLKPDKSQKNGRKL